MNENQNKFENRILIDFYDYLQFNSKVKQRIDNFKIGFIIVIQCIGKQIKEREKGIL